MNVDLVSSDGIRVAAHCETLALRSPVFYSMFTSNFMQSVVQERWTGVSIADVDPETLQETVRWVYTGTVGDGVMERLASSLF